MTRLSILLYDLSPEPSDALYVLFAVLTLALVSCSQRMPADRIADTAGKIMDEAVSAENFSGAVLLADAGGIVWKGAYGHADRDDGRPFTTSTPCYLASVSKQFTSAAILLLQEEGRLCLDDPVLRYLPELPSFFEGARLRHLLQHSSGIPDYYELLSPWPGITNRDVLGVLLELDSLNFPPGGKHSYSNSGYVLLSMVVEAVSGLSFRDFLSDRIFGRLGMSSTSVLDDFTLTPPGMAISYLVDGSSAVYRFNTTGGGGLCSTVEDLFLWDRALLNGTGLSRDLLEKEAWQPAILDDGDTVYYGLGWRLEQEEPGLTWHDGDLEGYRTFFLHDDRRNVAVIALSNSAFQDMPGLGFRLYEILAQKSD